MKKLFTILLLIFLAVPILVGAARTEGVWQERLGTYLETAWNEGRNILINGTNKYLNFGTTSGESGYGFRDNSGQIQFKHDAGSWADVGGGGSALEVLDESVSLSSAVESIDFEGAGVEATNVGNAITVTVSGGGGAGSAGGTWSTTTSQVSGQLINYSNNTDDVVVIGASATTSGEFYFDPNVPEWKASGSLQSQLLSSSTATSSLDNGIVINAGCFSVGGTCLTSNAGTVTSVAMTVPTGLTIAGSPITTSGTFALAFDTNYFIPTTTRASNWDTAFTNNHVAVTVSDSSEIDFTLATQDVTASLVAGSIDETKLDTSTNASLDLADSALQNVAEDTTPQLGGELDAQGNDIIDLADITFRTGATGGTLRTGTSNADKYTLQAYDVNDTTYRTLVEADAGNTVRLQIMADFLEIEDNTDSTKQVTWDISGATTGTLTDLVFAQTTNRTITFPDATDTLVGKATTDTFTNKTFDANGTGNSISNIDLTADVINNLPVGNLNSGTGASASTFWRGDGTWATPAGGSGTVGTSSSETAGQIPYWTTTSATPALLGGIATGTLTESVTGLEFDASRYVLGGSAALSLSSGYIIPLSASTTNWNDFYDTPSGRITAGDALTWSSNTLNFDGGNAPAGELGGTWASPTIDDSLAVSSWNLTTPTLTSFFGTPCTGNEFLQDISDTGAFSCAEAAGGGTFSWDVTSYGVSTSTIVGFTGGMLSTASSTFTGASTTITNLVAQGAVQFFTQFWNDLTDFVTYIRSLFTAGTGIDITAGAISFDVTDTNINATSTLSLSAGGGIGTITGGATGPTQVEFNTSDMNFDVLDFSTSVNTCAYWQTTMPDKYTGGAVSATFHWTATSSSGTVTWGIKARSFNNDNPLDTAHSATTSVTDTLIATNDMHVSPATALFTPTGSPAGGSFVNFEVCRDVADTLGTNARLLSVSIEYPIQGLTD